MSNKQITRESGVLDLLSSGENVMLDHGFDLKATVPDGVMVSAKRDQLTASETEETMTIASVQIHEERAIFRTKTYHILDGN